MSQRESQNAMSATRKKKTMSMRISSIDLERPGGCGTGDYGSGIGILAGQKSIG